MVRCNTRTNQWREGNSVSTTKMKVKVNILKYTKLASDYVGDIKKNTEIQSIQETLTL